MPWSIDSWHERGGEISRQRSFHINFSKLSIPYRAIGITQIIIKVPGKKKKPPSPPSQRKDRTLAWRIRHNASKAQSTKRKEETNRQIR
jgi:hypothetical protein